MVRWDIWVCSLLLSVLITSIDGVNIQVVHSFSEYETGRVTVRCDGMGQIVLFRKLGDVTDQIQDTSGLLSDGFTFVLSPSLEGYYFCGDNLTNSTEVVLVAFPFTNLSIERVHRTRIGSVFRMPCTIPFGNLVERYSVQWFKGVDRIDTAADSRIAVDHTSAALIFNGVEASDHGDSYYCVVTVQSRVRNITRQGATISLIIEEPLRLETGLENIALRENGNFEFICVASGLPAPAFQWLINGKQQNVGISPDEYLLVENSTIKTTSRFSMSAVDASKNGQVTCVAQHVRNGDVTIASSTANAIVLTNNFQTELIRQEGKIVLRGRLLYSIPGVFSLVIRFFNSPDNFEESIVFDPSLTDTKNINIQIPREKLPSTFKEFHVQVALKVGETLGPFSPSSNQISYDAGSSGNPAESCICGTSSPDVEIQSTMTSVSNTIIVAVVVILIVLVALAIVVLIIGCVFLYNKKVNLEKAYNISSHASHGSLHRCASRTSCSSHGSRRSERSYKSSSSSASSSSHASSRGMDCKDIELGVIQETGEVASATYENMHKVEDEKDGLRDVRDFETMDHRALKQREELRANIRTSLDQRAGVPTAVREPEPVFPKTHIGAINPIPFRQGRRNRQKQGRDSGSSFEDLEEDLMEIQHKSF